MAEANLPYNGAGVFSTYTPGNPVVAGTVISSTWANNTLNDIANNGLSNAITKDGQTTATAGIGFYAGTVSLPGIYLSTDTATGFYRIALNNNGYTVNGTKLLDMSAALFAVTGAISATTTGKVGTTLGVGNATPAASGAGITFPATQSASSDANTLDDYEEGTWTPIISSTGGGTATYAGQDGSYIKIGRKVTVNFDLTLATKGTLAAGATSVGGIPFTSLNDNSARGASAVLFGDMTASLVNMILYAEKNATSFPIRGLAAAGTSVGNISVADLANTTSLITTISYPASA